MKDRIVFKLVNAGRNKDKLAGLPHRRFHDLAVVFYAMLGESKMKQGFVEITNDMMRYWNITLDELETVAKENAIRLNPAQIFEVAGFIDNVLGKPEAVKNILDDEDSICQFGQR